MNIIARLRHEQKIARVQINHLKRRLRSLEGAARVLRNVELGVIRKAKKASKVSAAARKKMRKAARKK